MFYPSILDNYSLCVQEGDKDSLEDFAVFQVYVDKKKLIENGI